MLRWLSKWHPQARLGILFVAFFLFLQMCYLLSILAIPTAINPGAATVLLIFPPMWLLTATIATGYLIYNASRLNVQYNRRVNYTAQRNLFVAWSAPLLMAVLIFVMFFTPLVEEAFRYRREANFNASRDEMLAICEEILEEGSRSDAIRSNTVVGVFTQVRISLRADESQVWFDVGDVSGEVGYICIQPGASALQDDERYEYERKDDRFYFFLEREEARRERLNEEESDEE